VSGDEEEFWNAARRHEYRLIREAIEMAENIAKADLRAALEEEIRSTGEPVDVSEFLYRLGDPRFIGDMVVEVCEKMLADGYDFRRSPMRLYPPK